MTLVIDVETVPLDDAMAAPYPVADRHPPGNYKADDAIAKWRAADEVAWKAARAKECSINPRLGRVLCVGMTERVAMADVPSDERDVLEVFWREALRHNGRVVTWNGSWDLRFLVIRSLALGVVPGVASETIRWWFSKYGVSPHFDCKAVLMNWAPPTAGEGLSEWAAFFGCGGKCEGMSGADVYPMYKAGKLEEIRAYCHQDVLATLAIYNRIAPMFAGDLL